MPTYEYVCKACSHAWEAEQRISDAPLKECPKCHAPQAERQISGGNFILKGGGWYADLYSSSSPSKEKKSGGGEAKSETKSESSSTSTTSAPTTTPTPAKKD